MKIDKQKIARITSLSPNEFASLVYNVVLKAGGDRNQAQMAMSIAPMIHSKLKTASEEELNKIVNMIGEEKVRGIFDSLDA